MIAEDSLQQRWYAGPIDVWLRDPATHKEWIYRNDAGEMRDIYVDSGLPTFDRFEALASRQDVNVWLITSAESHGYRDQGLDAPRLEWIEGVFDTHEPLFTGRDGTSFVYCLSCRGSEPRACR